MSLEIAQHPAIRHAVLHPLDTLLTSQFQSSLSQSDGASFRIRAARRGDASEIVGLLTSERGTPNVETVGWIISHPEAEVTVGVNASDRAIGVVTLYHGPSLSMGGRCGTIDDLCVTRPWRRRGVGRALLESVVARASVLSVRRLELRSYGDVTLGMKEFLHACGFQRVATTVFERPC